MSRIVGLIEPLEREIVVAPVPSPVDVAYHWREVAARADIAEHALAAIYGRLDLMKLALHMGLTSRDEYEQMGEWWWNHFHALSRYLQTLGEESYTDGSGI